MLRPALLCLLLAAPAAAQTPMRLLEASPAASSVMDGNRQEFVLRFDGPVDHQASRLEIHRDGALTRTLAPRLGASPNTLYAAAGSLAAGDYELHWAVRPRPGVALTTGVLAFRVQP